VEFAPETLWLLPGLWQVLVSLGVFAPSGRCRARSRLAGAWYFNGRLHRSVAGEPKPRAVALTMACHSRSANR